VIPEFPVFFIVKKQFFIVKFIGKNARNFRIYNTRKIPIKPTFRKKSIEKVILINFQPFQKQTKVFTKFHNLKPQEMKKKIGRRVPPLTPSDPP